jgi:hypothetical protein
MLVSGGFSPRRSSLLSASPEGGSVRRAYHNRRPSRLRFVLGFTEPGARLRLLVSGPDGRSVEKEGASTVTIEVPEAAAGEWTYTITPLSVPYPNYPFTLTVGER